MKSFFLGWMTPFDFAREQEKDLTEKMGTWQHFFMMGDEESLKCFPEPKFPAMKASHCNFF